MLTVELDRRHTHLVCTVPEMLRTFYLDVNDATRTINRFEVRFVLDDEAINHSKELAASLGSDISTITPA